MPYVKPTLKTFLDTLTADVLTASTFLDWPRITQFTQTYRRELALLGSLDKQAPVDDLADLLLQKPTTLTVLKTLIAHGSDRLELFGGTVVDFSDGPARLQKGDRDYAREVAQLFADMGLVQQLQLMRSVVDYSKGTLVGLEPNKRKNRRGEGFQSVLMPMVIDQTIKKLNAEYAHRLTYKPNIAVSLNGDTKHLDFAIFVRAAAKPAIAFEVNFYATQGSKPSETLTRAYPDVQQQLRKLGIALIVVTDGMGWRKMEGALKTALGRLDYLLNYQLARGGAH